MPVDERRFTTSRATLLADRAMTAFIKIGGIGIIIAVMGIFVFILAQIVPLFRGARVDGEVTAPLPVPAAQVVAMALDEWGQRPAVIAADGTTYFISPAAPTQAPSSISPALTGRTVTARQFDARHARLILGCQDGSLLVSGLHWERSQNGIVSGDTTSVLDVRIGDKPLTNVAYAEAGDRRLAVVVQADGRVTAAGFSESGGLVGPKTLSLDGTQNLDGILGTPQQVLVDERCERIVIATTEGDVYHFARSDGDHFTLAQPRFCPFGDTNTDADHRHIASIDWLLGDVSLVMTSTHGLNRQFSLFRPTGSDTRQFGQTKTFATLPTGADAYAASSRNKCFLLAAGHTLTLRHGTSASERIALEVPYASRAVAISGKYQRIATAGDDGKLRLYDLDDPHPEAGLAALFGPVWYEGNNGPTYDWQSTGGSDDFEPKLSMIPLIWGTLKATLCAMIFAVPIALLAAIYTAEFMHPRFKRIVKPMMEVMASLPSVVLGFLAALWLAPLIEERVPSLITLILILPTTAMLAGWWWSGLPMRWRSLVKPGYEYLALVPLLVAVAIGAWSLGPVLEGLVFTVPGHDGHMVADFRQWWVHATGLSFEQRNALVVGIMMGFAIIPLVFTISEDALSNVPKTLRSASLALGASRWQTAMRVVMPTASAGIFSALMIGLGRAIGETMIVVMATGNTPIMTGNLFDGIRTLSANIAVELPEAPQHGTLFRTLFLGAFLLFSLTFIVNTVAELLRQHLREKYKTV
jgi:phosphate transport system permease protein